MKIATRLTVISIVTAMLVSCASGTPDCADSQVKKKLSEIAENYLSRYATSPSAHESMPQAVKDRIAFEFRSIRTTEHDKDADTYQCTSLMTVELDGGAGGKWQRSLDYAVYTVEDKDSSFEVDYDKMALFALTDAADKLHAIIQAPIKRQEELQKWEKELQAIRNAGGTGTDVEKMRMDFVRNVGGEPPAATEEQKQLAIEAMLKMYDPQRQYENVPEEVLRQVRERVTRELAEHPQYNMYGQPITVWDLTGQTEGQQEERAGESTD